MKKKRIKQSIEEYFEEARKKGSQVYIIDYSSSADKSKKKDKKRGCLKDDDLCL